MSGRVPNVQEHRTVLVGPGKSAHARTNEFGGLEPPNNRVNATVRPVTPLAVASVAPVRPARYAVRYTH